MLSFVTKAVPEPWFQESNVLRAATWGFSFLLGSSTRRVKTMYCSSWIFSFSKYAAEEVLYLLMSLFVSRFPFWQQIGWY